MPAGNGTFLFDVGLQYAQRLIREIEESRTGWRLERESKYRRDIETYVAIRESIAEKLAPSWWWSDAERLARQVYLVDPLGERIPAVWADLMFGEEPVFEAGLKGDQDHLDEWIEVNEFPSQLRWAEEMCSSEGETWWRHVSVPALGHCITEFHSRLNVIPLFIGRKLVAAAFVSILEQTDREETVYLEVHGEGVILNRLYRAAPGTKLSGKGLPLGSHDATENLLPVWSHGLEMLCGRVPNKLGRDWRIGLSDYKGISGLLLALNETVNVAQENLRLTGKQKVVIPERYLNLQGRLPQGTEIIVATEVDQDPDKVKNDFAQITWEFDAAALIAYQESLTNTILTRARVAPQLAGMGSEGPATGPGWRSRLVDTLLALDGKAAYWDDALPDMLQAAMRVENLRGLRGGWKNPDKPPTFKRNDALPDDPEGLSRRTVMEVNANVRSRKTAIAMNNPNWGDQRVDEELERIRAEKDLMLKATAAPDGNQRIPDPAGGIPREPGREDPTAVPDPRRAPSG
jgi:hypothetical protein